MGLYMVLDSQKDRTFELIMECIHDTQVTTVSVQHLLTDLLGEESGARVCALVERFGEDGERAVLPLIEEIIRSRAEILECKEVIEHLRRQLFGPKRERYIDPNQGE